jgi:hypothetical protein
VLHLKKISSANRMGSMCTIELPYQVEPKMVLCTRKWILNHIMGSVSFLYVVLQRLSSINDEYETNSMAVRVSNGYQKKGLHSVVQI